MQLILFAAAFDKWKTWYLKFCSECILNGMLLVSITTQKASQKYNDGNESHVFRAFVALSGRILYVQSELRFFLWFFFWSNFVKSLQAGCFLPS